MSKVEIRRGVWSLGLVAALVGGCPDESAEPRRDQSVPDASIAASADAGTMARPADGGPIASDDAARPGGDGPGADSGRRPDDETCESLVDAQIALCAHDPDRVCRWRGYRELCRSGNHGLLKDALQCLSRTECRSFGDPNEGQRCLDALGARIPEANVAFIRAVLDRCGGGPWTPTAAIEVFPFVRESALSRCSAEACSFDAIVASCGSSLPRFTCGE